MAVKTPLKWVGSKARLMPQLLPRLPKGQRLVEPFAGSCAVMMNTDYDKYLIADINPDLINFYQQAACYTDELILWANAWFYSGNTESIYYQTRNIFNNDKSLSVLERAAIFLYLNRHGYGGLCRYNKNGYFNVPFGNYKNPYFPEHEIRVFAEKAKRAEFVCAGYVETLRMVRPGDIVYCDPPYIPAGKTSDFTQYHSGGFCSSHQEHLRALLLATTRNGIPVVASNSDTSETRRFYDFLEFNIIELNSSRSIGAAKGGASSAKELLAVSQ